MKKLLTIVSVLTLSLVCVFAGGAKESATNTLKVAATPDPHAALLNLVVDDLAKEGITLEVIEFTDYITPNTSTESGEVDANFFQHLPYLETFNKDHGTHLVSVGGVHVEPLAVYSKKVSSFDELKSGATIAIPNDPTNEGRALLLLESAGVIELDEAAGLEATPQDITSNSKSFKFVEVEAASLPRVLSDVDAAVINGNYAIPAGLIATRDGLLVEGADSPYVNAIVVKEGNENNAAVQALYKALQSDEVKQYVAEKYPNGEVVLAF